MTKKKTQSKDRMKYAGKKNYFHRYNSGIVTDESEYLGLKESDKHWLRNFNSLMAQENGGGNIKVNKETKKELSRAVYARRNDIMNHTVDTTPEVTNDPTDGLIKLIDSYKKKQKRNKP